MLEDFAVQALLLRLLLLFVAVTAWVGAIKWVNWMNHQKVRDDVLPIIKQSPMALALHRIGIMVSVAILTGMVLA